MVFNGKNKGLVFRGWTRQIKDDFIILMCIRNGLIPHHDRVYRHSLIFFIRFLIDEIQSEIPKPHLLEINGDRRNAPNFIRIVRQIYLKSIMLNVDVFIDRVIIAMRLCTTQ